VFGDGVDNDCDGLIDEELCTGANRDTDTDGDELLDEDCALIREIADGEYKDDYPLLFIALKKLLDEIGSFNIVLFLLIV